MRPDPGLFLPVGSLPPRPALLGLEDAGGSGQEVAFSVKLCRQSVELCDVYVACKCICNSHRMYCHIFKPFCQLCINICFVLAFFFERKKNRQMADRSLLFRLFVAYDWVFQAFLFRSFNSDSGQTL